MHAVLEVKKNIPINGKKGVRFMQDIGLIAFVSMVCFILFVLYKEINYVPLPQEFNQKINLFKPLLDYYYIDFSTRKYLVESKNYIFDRDGVPILRINKEDYYHPVLISQFALGAFEYYLNTKDTNANNVFLRCADWLNGNLRKHGNFFYWEYNFNPPYDFGGPCKLPWFSAMAQGEGASVLLRAFSETKNDKYLQAANKAITPISYDISEGGISTVEGRDYIFPQEYPSTNFPSDVLNGAIAAYFGVYDYYRVSGDSHVRQLHETIVRTLLSVIDRYDTGYWSLYSRWPQYLAPSHYNSLHVTQLRVLYLITGESKFLRYSEKFAGYQNNCMNRTKYVSANHLRQVTGFSFGDIRKIPEFVKKALTQK